MMKLDYAWFDRVKADVDGVDFTNVEARRTFSNALRRNYTARELFMLKEFVENTPNGWGAFTRAGSDPRACRLLWDGALEEAKSLIVQIRANGGGAITRPVVEMEGSGEKVPNPEMLWDLPDGLWDLPIVTLRTNAARAMAAAATMQVIADEAHAARVAAERAADELAGWRDWIKRIGKADGKRDAQRRTPPLCRPMADAVCTTWNDYESGTADCELPNGKLRKLKRTYGECLEAHGKDIVYHSNATGRDYTLFELAPDAATFKRIVNAGRMRENRQPAPTRKRKNAQAAHKRARK